MENKKCSSKMHNNNDAISYCEKCNIFMCKKCENLHNELFQEHNSYNIKNNLEEIFTGFCMEKDHLERLQYYCKDHNKLCCASCITKIKGKGYGQHTDCQICFIEEQPASASKNTAAANNLILVFMTYSFQIKRSTMLIV